jgi:transposase
MNTPLPTVFEQGLSRSATAARQLLGHGVTGIVVSDRFSAYSWRALAQRQLCWAHLRRDLTAIAERFGASGEIGRELLEQQEQLFHHWHQWRDGEIDREQLQRHCARIRQQFEDTLQQASDLSFAAGGEETLGLHSAHLPSDPVRGSGAMELPGGARHRAHPTTPP